MEFLKNHDFDHETRKSELFACYRLKINDFLSGSNQNLKIDIFRPLQQIPCYCKSRLGTLRLISWWRVTNMFILVMLMCLIYCTFLKQCEWNWVGLAPMGSPSRGGGVSRLSSPTPFSPIFVCPSAYRNLSPVLLFTLQLLPTYLQFSSSDCLFCLHRPFTYISLLYKPSFATSLFLTHFQSLEVGRCLPSGRGENRASTHNDKHGCRIERGRRRRVGLDLPVGLWKPASNFFLVGSIFIQRRKLYLGDFITA